MSLKKLPVRVETIEAVYEGNVLQLDENNAKITLSEAKVYTNNGKRQINGIVQLHRCDIVKLDFGDISNNGYNSGNNAENDSLDAFVVTEAEECGELIQVLEKKKRIAFSLHGIGEGRYCDIAWFAFAISDEVILFDYRELSQKMTINEALKPLLESDNVLKVMHDCRLVADTLLHKCNISLRNVSDTQLLHAYWGKLQNGAFALQAKDLRATLTDVEMDDNLRFDCKTVSPGQRLQQPLSTPQAELSRISQDVKQLLPLQQGLVNAIWSELRLCHDIYLDSFRTADEETFQGLKKSQHQMPSAFKELNRPMMNPPDSLGQLNSDGFFWKPAKLFDKLSPENTVHNNWHDLCRLVKASEGAKSSAEEKRSNIGRFPTKSVQFSNLKIDESSESTSSLKESQCMEIFDAITPCTSRQMCSLEDGIRSSMETSKSEPTAPLVSASQSLSPPASLTNSPEEKRDKMRECLKLIKTNVATRVEIGGRGLKLTSATPSVGRGSQRI